MLDKDYWNNRYLHNEIQWDLGVFSPPIKNWLDQQKDKNINVLVPGAGFGHEVIYAYKNGFKNIYYLDYATKAIVEFKKKCPDFPKEQIMTQDFFSLTKNDFFDVILEQTFFCAIEPNLRKDYVEHTSDLLNKNGKIIGVLFAEEFGNDHPPFGGTKEEYLKLVSSHYEIEYMQIADNSIETRKGREFFISLKKQDCLT